MLYNTPLNDGTKQLIGQTELAILLQKIDAQLHAAEIRQLLTSALSSAEQMQLPEQETIRKILRQSSLA